MRKIIILGALAAVFGFAALAQASDQSREEIRDAPQVTRAAANDSRGDRHEGDTRNERSHERHDGSDAKRKEGREGHHEDEPAEHRDRR